MKNIIKNPKWDSFISGALVGLLIGGIIIGIVWFFNKLSKKKSTSIVLKK